MTVQKTYRPNVGIAVFNKQGQVLVCQWDTSISGTINKELCWQMPQGGIDNDETPLKAAYREIKEETNIDAPSLKFLRQASRSFRYTFSKEQAKYLGQDQMWLAFEFTGNDDEIDVINCPDPCFSKWRWEKLAKTPDLIIPFKKESYQFMVSEFKEFSNGF